MWFQSAAALMFLYAVRRRGNTLEALAKNLGMPAAALSQTVAHYNELAQSRQQDAMGKPKQFFSTLNEGPFCARDCSSGALMMCPTLSQGDLKVKQRTGEVLSAQREAISGLYAAGRSAVGVASHSYVSGLSIADCVFSGRRAGRHAAMHCEYSTG